MKIPIYVVTDGPLSFDATAPSVQMSTSCGEGRTAVDLFTDHEQAERVARSFGDSWSVTAMNSEADVRQFVAVTNVRHADWVYTIDPTTLAGECEHEITFYPADAVLEALAA